MTNERKKIIAVDDNVENLTALKDTLKEVYEVYPCRSAVKMFELLKHIMPDLVLMDVEMPEMNGFEAVKRLKSNEKFKHIPVMFLTVRDDVNSEIDGLSLGAIDYIHKPFVAPLLLLRIKTHIAVIDYQKIEVISISALTAMKHVKEGFTLVDTDNNYLSSNPAMAKMLPEITKIKKGEPVFEVKNWPDELKNNDYTSIELSITAGKTRYFRVSVSPVFIEKNTLKARIYLFTDITGDVHLMRELEKSACTDSLTGIYNRRHFIELGNVDIKRAARINMSVYTAMLDIDFFKKINDTYGHAAGDAVLKNFADTVCNTIRSYDLLGRYGGDEFIFLFMVNNETEVRKIVERIRESIGNSVTYYDGNEIKLTCSIGLAKFLENDTLETSVRKADEALYTAKHSGRNQIKTYGH
ncbi:MAG: diguanylate cyclase [Treponema sp.]|jgi:diguanylate cyclase (GGDEF)-like protein|nr:diguanylate cyclase [Treponema sp.]